VGAATAAGAGRGERLGLVRLCSRGDGSTDGGFVKLAPPWGYSGTLDGGNKTIASSAIRRPLVLGSAPTQTHQHVRAHAKTHTLSLLPTHCTKQTHTLRPHRGTYEIVATHDYMVRPPMPVTHVFLIDVSMAALGSGATAAACQCIEQVRRRAGAVLWGHAGAPEGVAGRGGRPCPPAA
jgi:hypothetical protein